MAALKRLLKKSESGKINHLLVLVDYENIIKSDEMAFGKKVLDFDKLREECLSTGIIILSLVFVPEHMLNDKFDSPRDKFYYGLTDYLYEKDFRIIACPSKALKQKDRVDFIMTEMGKDFINLIPTLSHIAIVAMDGDYMELANRAKNQKKEIILFCGEKVSAVLKKIAGTVKNLPMKEVF
jgi:hypothetical protein